MLHLFGRHRHLSQQVLNEYLDKRLPDFARQRAERALAACAVCNQELASLAAVTSMLRQALHATPRRSFIWTAPPPPAVRASLFLRLPNWSYAGAASLAGLVLAVMVSADAMGILSPPGQAAVGRESFMATPPSQELTVQGTPSPAGDTARSMKSADPASGSAESGQPPQPAAAAPTAPDATRAPFADVASPPSGPSGAAPPLPGAELTAVSTEGAAEVIATYDAELPGATPVFWRALEGAVAVAALGFLLALLLRRRRVRG
ncbi:MAG: hypothetical protein EXR54_01640 [Dehalococcoidia bacterium]|nr:hypothetical protein [Dehalococcoidia bacterium]MSQ16262.1 hypothetical protein [Dehalococcoidia bacterium]